MDANGGHRHELTSGRFNDIVPSWSLDGRWIYFGSNRAGMWNIWRIASDGSSVPQRVTTGIGAIAKESLDGKWLYYSRMNEAGIWRCPISGGSEEKVLNLPTLEYSGYWSPSPSGVYVIAQGAAGQYQILSFDLAAQKRTTLYTLQHLPTLFAGLSLSPSGHTLIFSEMKRAESDINLVEHFQ
jgi:Tol biopolymer transport system component